MTLPTALLELLQATVDRLSTPSVAQQQLQESRTAYFAHLLPLHSLAQLAAEGDDEASEVLARVFRGQARSKRVDLSSRLEGAYADSRQELEMFAFLDGDSTTSLLDYIDSLFAQIDSLNSLLLSQRVALLDLLTSPALARPALPATPDLASSATAMRHSTATLATAQSKLALLVGTAKASHAHHRVGETAALSLELYEGELQGLRNEVRGLEKELGRYEALMAGEGDGRVKGGYRKLLRDWRELESEEKDARGDLRRLGWVEG